MTPATLASPQHEPEVLQANALAELAAGEAEQRRLARLHVAAVLGACLLAGVLLGLLTGGLVP